MIKVTLGVNFDRKTVIIDENTTLRNALEEAGIDYSRTPMQLDGSTLHPSDLDKTFAQHGITEKAFVIGVVKADNAA